MDLSGMKKLHNVWDVLATLSIMLHLMDVSAHKIFLITMEINVLPVKKELSGMLTQSHVILAPRLSSITPPATNVSALKMLPLLSMEDVELAEIDKSTTPKDKCARAAPLMLPSSRTEDVWPAPRTPTTTRTRNNVWAAPAIWFSTQLPNSVSVPPTCLITMATSAWPVNQEPTGTKTHAHVTLALRLSSITPPATNVSALKMLLSLSMEDVELAEIDKSTMPKDNSARAAQPMLLSSRTEDVWPAPRTPTTTRTRNNVWAAPAIWFSTQLPNSVSVPPTCLITMATSAWPVNQEPTGTRTLAHAILAPRLSCTTAQATNANALSQLLLSSMEDVELVEIDKSTMPKDNSARAAQPMLLSSRTEDVWPAPRTPTTTRTRNNVWVVPAIWFSTQLPNSAGVPPTCPTTMATSVWPVNQEPTGTRTQGHATHVPRPLFTMQETTNVSALKMLLSSSMEDVELVETDKSTTPKDKCARAAPLMLLSSRTEDAWPAPRTPTTMRTRNNVWVVPAIWFSTQILNNVSALPISLTTTEINASHVNQEHIGMKIQNHATHALRLSFTMQEITNVSALKMLLSLSMEDVELAEIDKSTMPKDNSARAAQPMLLSSRTEDVWPAPRTPTTTRTRNNVWVVQETSYLIETPNSVNVLRTFPTTMETLALLVKEKQSSTRFQRDVRNAQFQLLYFSTECAYNAQQEPTTTMMHWDVWVVPRT